MSAKIKDWYAALPQPIQSRAYINAGAAIGQQCSSMSAAINVFNWSGTDEGNDYWNTIYTLTGECKTITAIHAALQGHDIEALHKNAVKSLIPTIKKPWL